MNGQDLLEALSGLDPKYIDEAAYELKESSNVVDITSANRRRNVRKLLYVVLPSVAAILLIVAVAIPAILRVSKSESATMSEAPAAASEAAAPAEDAAMTEGAEPEETMAKRADNEEAVAEAAEAAEAAEETEALDEAGTPKWQMTEATYENGILTVDLSGEVPEDILEKDYYLIAQDPASTQEDILGAPLADIAGKDALKDGHLVLDLSSQKLQKGAYVIEIEGVSIRFEVK